MPRPRNRDPFAPDDVDNDGLGLAQTTERATWSLPSDEGQAGQEPARLPAGGFDYSGGLLVGHGEEADAQAPPAHPHLLRARVDAPRSFELPHEATHRRYEPLFVASIAQQAAGFTVIAAPSRGLHYVKVIAAVIFLDAAGTLKFVQGSTDGTSTGDLTGAMPIGTNGGFVLPPADLQNPWLYSSPDQALGIFTVTGKAFGWAQCCYAPYDS
jgi:hypothetical protein